MNDKLTVTNLLNKTNTNDINSFNGNIHSNFSIASKKEKVTVNFEWLELMEDTIHYIDNVLRNPNRFIVNDEEVVKIEQARRITVESIKHLARHTNYIQEIEANGDVMPSKILNINKDESYNTYENRLVYTLIQNMNEFLYIKKKDLVVCSSNKDIKKCNYNGISQIGNEKININLSLDSRNISRVNDGSDGDLTLNERIEKLEVNIKDLMNSDVYKSLAKAHIAKIIPPIKKTNLILKNTNFQYIMRLWDYLQANTPDDNKVEKSNATYDGDSTLKSMLDETFLLNYLIVNSVDGDAKENKNLTNDEAISSLTDSLINKIVELNANMPIEKLQSEIGTRIAINRTKYEANLSELQKIYTKNIDKFIEKIESFKF
jgi:hypothetical protein